MPGPGLSEWAGRGQALLEFLLELPLLLAIFAGASALFRAGFQRTQCAYLTFEAAHRELTFEAASPAAFGRTTWITGILARPPKEVHLIPTADGVEAIGRCGKAVERVRLPYLERAKW